MKLFPPITGLALLVVSLPAIANDGAMHAGSRGPEPLEKIESPVRMVAEHIEVEFGAKRSTVHCTFRFRNTKTDAPVTQLLGFPDEGAALHHAYECGWPMMDENLSPIIRMRTEVNGRPAKSQLQVVEVAPGDEGTHFAFWDAHHQHGVSAWYTLKVKFPVGRDVIVERFYTVENGWTMPRVKYFHYTTETGGAWKGTIGRLQADVTLRDGLTASRLVWPGTTIGESTFEKKQPGTTEPEKSAWQVLDKRHLRLVWKDFEPRTEPEHRGFTVSRRSPAGE